MMKHLFFACCVGLVMTACDEEKQASRFERIDGVTSSIVFRNDLQETDTFNYFIYSYIYMGGGVAVGDFNADGLEDIYFTANMKDNALYLNQGDLRFSDVTMESGTAGDDRWVTGVTTVDINYDGLLDIYISVSGLNGPFENLLYVNKGNRSDGVPLFEEEADRYGIADNGHSTQGTFFDADNDGDLDLYVANYPITNFRSAPSFYAYMIRNPEHRHSSHFYENVDGVYVDKTNEAGVLNYGLSLSAMAGDYNNDGFIDLYVSNDFSCPDFFYINNGDGTFSDHLKDATNQTSFYGMGADAADFNNDGLLDLIQVDMAPEGHKRSKENMASMNPASFLEMIDLSLHHQYMFNSLQLNRGRDVRGMPRFSNIAQLAHTAKTDWSWAPLFADFDNDGWKDLFITNGTRRDINNRDFFKKLEGQDYFSKSKKEKKLSDLELMPAEAIPNYMFRNQHDLTFDNVAVDWGVDELSFSNGAAYADLDQDGDLDLVVNNIDGPAFVYRNLTSDRRLGNYLSVELKGPPRNPDGIGATVYVTTGEQCQMIQVVRERGFQSGVSAVAHFGLGEWSDVLEVRVEWPDGKASMLNNIDPNQRIKIPYEDASVSMPKPIAKPLFREISDRTGIDFQHKENRFDDFAREPLLPHRMSQFGPALAVGDVNGDELDDLFIGGALGQPGEMYLQEANAKFQSHKVNQPLWTDSRMHEDMDATFFDADQDGDLDLYVVSGGNEFPLDGETMLDRLYANDGTGRFTDRSKSLPKVYCSGGKVLPLDYDQDGDLDLFVGGRQVPGRYPTPADSYLLINHSDDNQLIFEKAAGDKFAVFQSLGMVTDAVAIDYDQDGDKDLVIAGEWMPITFLENRDLGFVDQTEAMGFAKSRGWWFSIASADLDGDGDEDLLVGNLGENYKYHARSGSSFDIYANDYDENGRLDIVLGFYENGIQLPVRGRQCSSEQIPMIQERYKDYASFADASLADIYSETLLENSLHYQVESFASVYLENLGNKKFNPRSLPNIAQLAPINDFVIADFNSDGLLDVLLAGNLFSSEVETPRADAGMGLLLSIGSDGEFKPVDNVRSGLNLSRDVKKMALVKGSSRPVIAIANNNSAMQLIEYDQDAMAQEK